MMIPVVVVDLVVVHVSDPDALFSKKFLFHVHFLPTINVSIFSHFALKNLDG